MSDIREAVREQYGSIAEAATKGEGEAQGCCAPTCCAPTDARTASKSIGYSDGELDAVPDGANLGLGCGNPGAIAQLQPGETVLDLGSGGGFDAFLAAEKVGPTGRVIGVDMTGQMVALARQNAAKAGFRNVDFRLGEIEALPVADGSVNAIMSNCVVNLSPDKPRVFAEAFRVLVPGGRLAISDVLATAPLPDGFLKSVEAYVGCVAGAATVDDTRAMLVAAGFEQVKVTVNEASRDVIKAFAPGTGAENYVASATVEAIRP